MSTAAQQTASRQNGALSNGPVTAEGKARAARNSTRHALTGGPTVLANESRKEYDAFKKSYLDTWQPSTLAERDIVEHMVVARWRLRRIEQMETAILNAAFERELKALEENGASDKDLAMSRAYADVTENSKGWRNLDRHQRTLQRSYDQALKALMILQEQMQKQLFERVQADIDTTELQNAQNEPGAWLIGTPEPAMHILPTRLYPESEGRMPDRAAA